MRRLERWKSCTGSRVRGWNGYAMQTSSELKVGWDGVRNDSGQVVIRETSEREALPSAAIICFSALHMDARVRRQIRALIPICKITAFGFTDPHIDQVQFVEVGRQSILMLSKYFGVCEKILRACLMKFGQFETAYRLHGPVRRAAKILKDNDFDLIVANDINALPVALTNRGQAKVLFDAHEYAPKQYGKRFIWRVFLEKYTEYLCRTRIRQADAMTTVGPVLAEEYARKFGVRPSVVLNTPRYHAIPYEPRKAEIIRMVHHGGSISFRRLEMMIDAMSVLDGRFRLDLMLIPSDRRYWNKLKKRAGGDPRIEFVPTVPPEDIVKTLTKYDLGVYMLPPYSFNARYALPNKFFEFLQARLCVAIGPSAEMKRLVDRFSCGIVATDFTSDALAAALSALDRRRVEAYRRGADLAASALCYERSSETLQATVRDLLER